MNELTVPINSTDHSLGLENAQTTIVKYGRYDCAHCKQVQTIIGSPNQFGAHFG